MPSLGDIVNARQKAAGKKMGALSFGDMGNLATPSTVRSESRGSKAPSARSKAAPTGRVSPRGKFDSSKAGEKNKPFASSRKTPVKGTSKAPAYGGMGGKAGKGGQMREAWKE